ncbi:S1/P1 nuclease [Flavobacterium granuli]|uniref:Uncharacterized protein n=1 Tax=Flavobacterium granuli TaxID=280093 RepID=A0ABU1RX52_9FLAO|nr:S1/P1 nuclease [Flavobacterium granuli]MDR6843337.1 hypothetical protein [Flavobacterium granuli]
MFSGYLVIKVATTGWSKESRSLLDTIYNTGGANIKDSYVDASAITIESQIPKAGIRLAAILNSSFKS